MDVLRSVLKRVMSVISMEREFHHKTGIFEREPERLDDIIGWDNDFKGVDWEKVNDSSSYGSAKAGVHGGYRSIKYQKPLDDFTVSVEHNSHWLMVPHSPNDSQSHYEIHLLFGDKSIGSARGWRVYGFYEDIQIAHNSYLRGKVDHAQEKDDTLMEDALREE